MKFLRNFGIPQDFESAGSGILQKLQLSFLEILKFLGTQFSVVHRGGGGGVGGGGGERWGCVVIFWNSPIYTYSLKFTLMSFLGSFFSFTVLLFHFFQF